MGHLRQLLRVALVVSMGLATVVVVVMSLSALDVAADGEADLAVGVTAPAHVAPGSTFVATVAYRNGGTEATPDGQVVVTLPSGTQFVTATDRSGGPLPPDSIDGDTLMWDIGPLAADSGWQQVRIAEQVNDDLAEGTVLTNTAAIATTATESDLENNAASAASVVCDMAGSSKQVHAGEVMPGDVLTYTITVDMARRTGPGPQERGVALTDTMPFSHQVRFLGWTSELTGTHDGQQWQWQGRVRAGEPLTLQYRLGVEGVITPGTQISNVARLGWGTGEMRLGPVTTVVTLPHWAHMFGPGGGEWQHQHGVTLTVPPGAVTDTTRCHFAPLFTDTHPVSVPHGLMFAHRAFDLAAYRFGQDVHQFGQPLTVTVGYSGTDVAGLNRETLRLWTRSGVGEPWARLGEPSRVMSGSLAFTTTHFSQFALFGEPGHRCYLPLMSR
jgi:hypothetical protein